MMHSGRELFDKSKRLIVKRKLIYLSYGMPYVSSIVPKLVPAVTIVMPLSDGTRNPTQCEFFQHNKMCSSILERREYVLDQPMLLK